MDEFPKKKKLRKRGVFSDPKKIGHEIVEKFATSFTNGGNVPDKMKGPHWSLILILVLVLYLDPVGKLKDVEMFRIRWSKPHWSGWTFGGIGWSE